VDCKQRPGDHRVEVAEVHLGLRARQVHLRHRDLDPEGSSAAG